MRILAYDDGGIATMGVVVADKVAPLAPLDAFWSDPARHLDLTPGDAVALSELALVPPVPMTCRVLCVGLNYRYHAKEAKLDLPKVPNVFARFPSTLAVHGAEVPVPRGEDGLDWEGELAVVVGRTLRGASVDEAARAIAFCAPFNDLSARAHQMASAQWALGKNADRSAPMGPALVTLDEAGALDDLSITTRANGRVVQSGSTRDMVFAPAEVLAYVSEVMTLQPGDVLATGTPEGIGFLRDPPELLAPGDTVEVEIGGLGCLTNTIVASVAPAA